MTGAQSKAERIRATAARYREKLRLDPERVAIRRAASARYREKRKLDPEQPARIRAAGARYRAKLRLDPERAARIRASKSCETQIRIEDMRELNPKAYRAWRQKRNEYRRKKYAEDAEYRAKRKAYVRNRHGENQRKSRDWRELKADTAAYEIFKADQRDNYARNAAKILARRKELRALRRLANDTGGSGKTQEGHSQDDVGRHGLANGLPAPQDFQFHEASGAFRQVPAGAGAAQ
jgi:hypothetical protein